MTSTILSNVDQGTCTIGSELARAIALLLEETVTKYKCTFSKHVPHMTLTCFGFLDSGMHPLSFMIENNHDDKACKIIMPKTEQGQGHDCVYNTDQGTPLILGLIKECENVCVTLSCPLQEDHYSTDAFKDFQEYFMTSCRLHAKDVITCKKQLVRLDHCDARYTSELADQHTVSFICQPPLIPKFFQLIGK